ALGTNRDGLLAAIRHGVIVSCQAETGSPLDAPEHIAAMAVSAERGGAVGLRIDHPLNVRTVRALTALPVIGIFKARWDGFDVYITPTFESADRKSTRLNSSHRTISYAVFCLKKKIE